MPCYSKRFLRAKVIEKKNYETIQRISESNALSSTEAKSLVIQTDGLNLAALFRFFVCKSCMKENSQPTLKTEHWEVIQE